MKKPLLIKSLLLLCALMVGNVAWADYEELFTIKSSNVVNNTSYTAYNTTVSSRDYVITFGGNNKSVGTNSNNRGNCKLTNYSKYAVSPVTTESVASAFACKTSISDVTKISYTFNGGSNQTNTKVYLLYSSDNSTFSQISLTSGTQGATISSGTAYTFTAKTGYFALLFEATNSSGNWRIDDVDITFYKTVTGASVEKPTIAPAAGAVDAGTKVTLTQAAADQIRYTTDGTDPTKTTGTVYSTPIEITTATTIKAIAIKGDDVSSVATADYTINVASPTFNLEGGSYMQGTNITITSAGNTIYYNLTTDGSTPGNPTNASTKYTAPIVLGSGKTIIKAIAYDTYGNASSVITRTYTGIGLASLPFNWAGGVKNDINALTGVFTYGLGSDYGDAHAPYQIKLDDTNDYIIFYMDKAPTKIIIGVKMIGGGTTSTIAVQESINGVDFSNVENLSISGTQNDILTLETTESFANTTKAIKLLFTKGSNVGIGPITIFSENDTPLTITTADYATFVSTEKTDFAGTGITAYTAKVNGNSVTLTSIEKVPANTPVVVYKDVAATTTFAVPVTTADIAAVSESENDLQKSDGTNAFGDNVYVLGNTNGIGFYKWTSNNSLSAGKVYLNVPAMNDPTESRDYLTFAFEDQATGVGASLMNSEKCKVNSAIFDLQGRRVVNPTKGLYIVNGKKVIVK